MERGHVRQRSLHLQRSLLLRLVESWHPHAIEVYDYGLDAAGPYYTRERRRSLPSTCGKRSLEAAFELRDEARQERVQTVFAAYRDDRLLHAQLRYLDDAETPAGE